MTELSAAVDLGTNTARLLIGRVENSVVEQHFIVRKITRLGGGFTKESGLSIEAIERNVEALREFKEHISRHKVSSIRAVATSAVRDAINGEDFCRRVHDEIGLSLEVIDGYTEGLLTLKGVLGGLAEAPERLLVLDAGGGSTEYTLAEGSIPLFSRSLPLGVVRLTEGKTSASAMTEKIERELALLKSDMCQRGLFPLKKETLVVGTAGTATTLAAISMKMVDYDYRRVNNYRIKREEIESIYNLLLPLAPVERLNVAGLEKGREDLIIAGILITLKTLETFDADTLTVSDFGLLEGVLMSIFK